MLDPSILRQYNSYRTHTDKSKLCHAPFTSLNFEQNGHVTACCFNRTDVLGTYPEQTIEEIWHSNSADLLRERISSNDLGGGCKLCHILLESGNYSGTKAIHYDEYGYKSPLDKLKSALSNKDKLPPPKVFEFEISNTCNLECTMCSGYFSSTIRKNREHLPLISSPYDEAFVEQVAKFIPHLTDLKFLGGEPFLIDIYYSIWEKVAQLNPKAKIHITTNGTVLNKKVKDLLSKLNVGIIVSIDSLVPESFEKIRVGAKLDKVLEHFKFFKELTKKKGTYLSIAACAMSNNWKDLPAIVEFANEQDVSLHFNVVWNPGHLSLRFLDYEELSDIEAYLGKYSFPTHTKMQTQNSTAYKELIQTISHWKKERSHTRLNNLDEYQHVKMQFPELLKEIPQEHQKMAGILIAHFVKEKSELIANLDKSLLPENFSELPGGFVKTALFDSWQKMGDYAFSTAYFEVLPYLATLFYGKEVFKDMQNKSALILRNIQEMKDQQAVLSDLIDDIDRKSIANQVQLLYSNPAEQIVAHIQEAY